MPPADDVTKAEVKQLLTDMAKFSVAGDVEGLMACYAPEPELMVVGTGRDEKLFGPKKLLAQYRRDLSQGKILAMRYKGLKVATKGKFAWCFAECTVRFQVGADKQELTGRQTSLLEKRRGKWLILQTHFSLPAAGQAEGQSFPAV